MLKKRIIPCLDIKDGRTVKGINFIDIRDAGDPIELAKKYVTEGADELVFLDITATIEKRKTYLYSSNKKSKLSRSMPGILLIGCLCFSPGKRKRGQIKSSQLNRVSHTKRRVKLFSLKRRKREKGNLRIK